MPVSFTSAGTSANIQNPTSLQFGADGRLYVSQQDGSISALTFAKQGDEWVELEREVLILENGGGVVKSIQNHNDDGSEDTTLNRQVTGIVVTQDEQGNIVLYVSSSDPRISTNSDIGLDTNSGVVSKVTQTQDGWEVIDLVRGLPRSEENHSVNGMLLSEDGTKLLLQVGGFTNNGAPSGFFSYTNEYALSGAVLELDLVALESLPDQIDLEGGKGIRHARTNMICRRSTIQISRMPQLGLAMKMPLTRVSERTARGWIWTDPMAAMMASTCPSCRRMHRSGFLPMACVIPTTSPVAKTV